jgi:3-isopropylmalate/(R)-2-methylmalate dehydratase large subunit
VATENGKPIALEGRALYLSSARADIEAQLAGECLSLARVTSLRDDISTDEITPVPTLVYFDSRLGDVAHTGFTLDGGRPIARGTLRTNNFSVLVAGARYGKGSSREHSPVAEKRAGITLVIAKSFERIYRQNADNVGLLTSTNFALLEKIEQGVAITLEEILEGRDALSAEIIRAGGLLKFGAPPNPGPTSSADVSPLPQTLAEKIIWRHLAFPQKRVSDAPLWLKPDLRFIHDIYTAMCANLLEDQFGDDYTLHDVKSILAFEDHYSYTHRSPAHVAGGLMPELQKLSRAHRDFARKHGLKDHGPLLGGVGSQGISHAIVAEQYALPGQLIAGTDSHTPHSGALGCLAFGVGTTDMANAFRTGNVRLRLPESFRIELNGVLPRGVSAKDVVLHLLARPEIQSGVGVGMVFEFVGEVVQKFSIDERATLCNMTAELGGLTGIVAPDDITREFIRERRGASFEIESWMISDPGARYAQEIVLDCSGLSPMVAAPGDPGNGKPLSELQQAIKIDIAYGGSCTAGKRDDFDRYHEVAEWAAERGLRKAEHVSLFLQFGTVAVRDYCIEKNYLAAFEAIGAEILLPACGACANCGPGVSTEKTQTTISAINRNFPGRSGPGGVWLASPATVIASAIAGRITSFDGLIQTSNF